MQAEQRTMLQTVAGLGLSFFEKDDDHHYHDYDHYTE